MERVDERGQMNDMTNPNSTSSRGDILKAQEKKIHENRTVLNRMVSETSEMLNQIGIASLTIERLKAELASVDHYVRNSKDYGAKLRLQAEKLDSEKAELSEKYEAILNKIQSQIKEKEQEIGEVNIHRNKILGIRDEESQRGKRLSNEIKKLDSVIRVMKQHVISQSSWNVRGSLNLDLTATEVVE